MQKFSFSDFHLMLFSPIAKENETIRSSRYEQSSPPKWSEFYRAAESFEIALIENRPYSFQSPFRQKRRWEPVINDSRPTFRKPSMLRPGLKKKPKYCFCFSWFSVCSTTFIWFNFGKCNKSVAFEMTELDRRLDCKEWRIVFSRAVFEYDSLTAG